MWVLFIYRHYVSVDQQLNEWTYYARLYPDILVKRSTKLNICWFSCFLGNPKCSHSTLTLQILLKRFSHHKSGRDRRHPHHSLIFPYINIHHLKCPVSSLFRKLKCIKKLECCKFLWHPSQSLLFPLVKFYFIIKFITSVDRLSGHNAGSTRSAQKNDSHWWTHFRALLEHTSEIKSNIDFNNVYLGLPIG